MSNYSFNQIITSCYVLNSTHTHKKNHNNDNTVPLTEESLDIFGAALLRPVGVLQVPDRPLLARQQVFDL